MNLSKDNMPACLIHLSGFFFSSEEDIKVYAPFFCCLYLHLSIQSNLHKVVTLREWIHVKNHLIQVAQNGNAHEHTQKMFYITFQ